MLPDLVTVRRSVVLAAAEHLDELLECGQPGRHVDGFFVGANVTLEALRSALHTDAAPDCESGPLREVTSAVRLSLRHFSNRMPATVRRATDRCRHALKTLVLAGRGDG